MYVCIYLFKDFKDSFFWFDRFSPFDLHSATLLRMLLHEVGDGHFLTDSSSKPSAQLPCQFTPRSLQTAMATAYLLWRSGARNFHCGLAQCNAIICSINVYKLKAIVDWSSRSWAKKNVQWMAINRIKKMEHSFQRKEMQRALGGLICNFCALIFPSQIDSKGRVRGVVVRSWAFDPTIAFEVSGIPEGKLSLRKWLPSVWSKKKSTDSLYWKRGVVKCFERSSATLFQQILQMLLLHLFHFVASSSCRTEQKTNPFRQVADTILSSIVLLQFGKWWKMYADVYSLWRETTSPSV